MSDRETEGEGGGRNRVGMRDRKREGKDKQRRGKIGKRSMRNETSIDGSNYMLKDRDRQTGRQRQRQTDRQTGKYKERE